MEYVWNIGDGRKQSTNILLIDTLSGKKVKILRSGRASGSSSWKFQELIGDLEARGSLIVVMRLQERCMLSTLVRRLSCSIVSQSVPQFLYCATVASRVMERG